MTLCDSDFLYHYTTPNGLIGIVENKILWATDVFYLNDSEEFIRGIQIARSYIQDLREKTTNKSTAGRLEWLLKETKSIGPRKKLRVYVSSLSSVDDQLSQWRAYCRGGGFAIGFNIGRLKELAVAQDFVLEQCIYKPEEQNQLITKAVDSIAGSWLSSSEPWPEKPPCEEPRFAVSGNLIHKLAGISPRLKNEAFREEQEYRLISRPTATFVKGQQKFRHQRSIVVPYREFRLDDKDLWRQVRVVVGPTPHREESEASVYELLRCNTGYGHAVRATKASYREW